MHDQNESDTVAGIQFSEEQIAIFEKINSESCGLDFTTQSGIQKCDNNDCEDTILIDESQETHTEIISEGQLTGCVSPLNLYLDLQQHIKKFESEIDEGYEMRITPANFNQVAEIRLVSVKLYKSGSICLQCENTEGKEIVLFDHITRVSFMMTQSSVQSQDKKQKKVEFVYE